MSRVAGPISGAACAPAASVSHNLTANSTTSTDPTAAGSAVAVTRGSVRSPRVLLSVSPRDWRAARLAPRAMNVTS